MHNPHTDFISARQLMGRLCTVAREAGLETEELHLCASIGDQFFNLTKDNFQVNHDGTLVIKLPMPFGRAQRLEQFRAYVQAVCEHPKHRTGYTLLQACALLDEIARQAVAAASPTDVVAAKQTYCRRELLALGKTAPRTCQRCGLLGPCSVESVITPQGERQ